MFVYIMQTGGTMGLLDKFLRIQAYKRENKSLTEQLSKTQRYLQIMVQAASDITVNDSTTKTGYTGLPYENYTAQTAALGRKYDNTDSWGNLTAKNIIDVRAAFSTGQGLRVIKNPLLKSSGERELNFCRDFIRFNQLDTDSMQEYAKEAEIEGKILFKFNVDMNAKNIHLIHVPWIDFQYVAELDANDPKVVRRVYYKGGGTVPNETGSEVRLPFSLPQGNFVYKRFGGRVAQSTNTPSKTAFVLRHIEDLDKAMWDWRRINKLHAAPTPFFKCIDSDEARELTKWLEDNNWRIGKAIASTAEFSLVGWGGDGFTTLPKEIETIVKIVSGATGVPVHFMGFPELLSNRDTADNLIELIALSTNKERKIWVEAYYEVLATAMAYYNDAFQSNLKPEAIVVKIPFVSKAKMDEITATWLPLYQANAITLHTLLDQLSGEVDVDDEIVKVEQQRKERQAEQNAAVLAGNNSGNGSGGASGNGRPRAFATNQAN
jgi:hypothetical protein